MRLPQAQLLYVLEAFFVGSYHRLFPLEKSHSSDLEPHASLDCPSVSAETLSSEPEKPTARTKNLVWLSPSCESINPKP